MFETFARHRDRWEDLVVLVLALGYIGGFLAAIELALARLVFFSAFQGGLTLHGQRDAALSFCL